MFREPLLHFFILGLLVFGLYSALEERPEAASDPLLVEVASADIEWFRTMWSKSMGREPTVEELRGLVNQFIREEVLSREAISMGLDKGDTVVRRRLTQMMDFMFKEALDIAEPTDEELKKYLNEKREYYERPGVVSFTHIYFNTDKRGEEKAAKAVRELVEKLNKTQGIPKDAQSMGDPFLLNTSYEEESIEKVRGDLGPELAKAIHEQAPGSWQGPVRSGFGLHAVYVQSRKEAILPPFEEIKNKLTLDWMTERRIELAKDSYGKVRSRYRVLLEGMPYDMDLKK